MISSSCLEMKEEFSISIHELSEEWRKDVQSKESITRHFYCLFHFFLLLPFRSASQNYFSLPVWFLSWQKSYFAYKSRTWKRGQKWKMCQHKKFLRHLPILLKSTWIVEMSFLLLFVVGKFLKKNKSKYFSMKANSSYRCLSPKAVWKWEFNKPNAEHSAQWR